MEPANRRDRETAAGFSTTNRLSNRRPGCLLRRSVKASNSAGTCGWNGSPTFCGDTSRTPAVRAPNHRQYVVTSGMRSRHCRDCEVAWAGIPRREAYRANPQSVKIYGGPAPLQGVGLMASASAACLRHCCWRLSPGLIPPGSPLPGEIVASIISRCCVVVDGRVSASTSPFIWLSCSGIVLSTSTDPRQHLRGRAPLCLTSSS